MAHASGNATWQDYPSTSTLVTATTLENQESAIDRVTTALFGAAGNTAAPVCEYQLTTAYTNLAAGDYVMNGNMTKVVDDFSMFSSAYNFYRVIIPYAGRWNVEWEWVSTATTGVAAGKVMLNVANGATTNSTTGGTPANTASIMSAVGAPGGEGNPVNINQSRVFAANDTVAFAVYSSVTFTIPVTNFGGIRTRFIVRWVGPK